MGKNKRAQIVQRDDFHGIDVSCDSIEECDFLCWCSEAAQLKIIKDYEYQPQSIKLFDAVDYINIDNKKRSLFREHVYSPDFMLKFDPNASRTLCREFKLPIQMLQQNECQIYLDVKGTYQKSDGGRSFSINQKWVYQKTGIYIVKLIPKDFFAKNGCPQACFSTKKTNKPRKAFIGYKTLPEMLCG